MLFWAREWYQLDPELRDFREAPVLIEVRARASQHGGETRAAVRPDSS
jgi:hypothetical protein